MSRDAVHFGRDSEDGVGYVAGRLDGRVIPRESEPWPPSDQAVLRARGSWVAEGAVGVRWDPPDGIPLARRSISL